jgi:EngA GTPase-like protein
MALDASPPPLRQNRRPKVYYATQVSANPPTIVLFTNGPELFDNTYQRYLIKTFRDQLPFHDVPIKLYLRNKRRAEPGAAPNDDTETDVAPKPRKGRKRDVDVSGLPFKTTLSDDEAKPRKSPYESELWKDI